MVGRANEESKPFLRDLAWMPPAPSVGFRERWALGGGEGEKPPGPVPAAGYRRMSRNEARGEGSNRQRGVLRAAGTQTPSRGMGRKASRRFSLVVIKKAE